MSLPSNSSSDPFLLRPKVKDDEGFIVDTWTRSYVGKICNGRAATSGQWHLASALIERCPVMVACFDEDPNYIVGWACTSLDTVHYVYVREENRRQGLSKRLLHSYLHRQNITYTHTPNRAWWPADPNRPKMVGTSKHYIMRVPATWRYDVYHAFEIAATVPSYRGIVKPEHIGK